MVTGFCRQSLSKSQAGYAISELIVSTSIFCSISMGLLMGFTSLERNYSATTDFTHNHADVMRISDYMAMDLLRASAVLGGKNGTTLFLPAFYLPTSNPPTPAVDGPGGGF